jgi:hypothetical protein
LLIRQLTISSYLPLFFASYPLFFHQILFSQSVFHHHPVDFLLPIPVFCLAMTASSFSLKFYYLWLLLMDFIFTSIFIGLFPEFFSKLPLVSPISHILVIIPWNTHKILKLIYFLLLFIKYSGKYKAGECTEQYKTGVHL